MKVITLCNHKSNTGKTITAKNLAVGFKTLNRKVLLIDLDPQSTLTKTLGYNEIFNLSNPCNILGSLRGEYELMPTLSMHDEFDIRFIPSTLDLATMELELAGKIGGQMRLSTLLGSHKKFL